MFKKIENLKLLTSGFDFDDSESDLLFRFRILNYFLLIGAIFSALIGLLGEIGVMKIGTIQPRADFVYAAINVVLMLKLRQSKELFTIISWIEVSSLFILIVLAMITVETDEFRMVWFYIVAYFSYLLLNVRAGIIYTGLSITAILLANYYMDLHLSETAIYTAVFGLVVIGIMSWASVTQLNLYELRQMIQNTKLKNSVEELDKALTEAKEANEIKSMFLANMSHEIRTPMNGILTLAQVLRTTNLDKEQASYLNTIEHSGEMLKTLIDDLLDLSSIEAGKLRINAKTVNVRSIFEDVLIQVEPLFKNRRADDKDIKTEKVSLNYRLDDDVPSYIIADDVRLKQVIINLIANAKKFTSHGEINLGVSGTWINESSFNLHVEVSDTGVGIPADKMDAIFESFHQLSEDRTYNSGIGLGLPISKKIVEAMQGSINVESIAGKGATFSIDIIFPVSELDSIETENLGEILEKITVLLVDDDRISRFAVKTLLNDQGHDVVTAKNGREAIDILKHTPVDAILMDVYMPELNGVDATKIIKSEKLSDAPIIGITASVMQNERESYFDAGMDALLEKPILFDQLIKTIKKNISG